MSRFIRRISHTGGDNNFDTVLFSAKERYLSKNLSHIWIVVRVHLHPMPAGSPIKVRPNTGNAEVEIGSLAWGGAEFNNFKIAFKYLCEEVWDNRLYIVVPEQSRRLPSDLRDKLIPSRERERGLNGLNLSTTLPAIQCCLEVQIVSRSDSPHVEFECFKIPNTVSATSFVEHGNRKGRLNNQDIINVTKVIQSDRGTNANQFSVAHELGHAMGLPHICGNTNDNSAYGHGTFKAFDIMGGGNRVSFHHARMWTDRMARHTTDRVNWNAVEASRYLQLVYQRDKDILRARGKRINPRDTMP